MKIGKFRYIFAAVLIAALLLKKDCLSYLVWWMTLLALGWIFFPVTAVLFKNFQNKGYVFSKAIGLAVSGYLLWVFSSFQILPFTAWAAYLVLALCLAGNLLLSKKFALYDEAFQDAGFLDRIIRQEALFMVMLALWSYLRARKPEIIGLEKFMDFGFVNAILRSEYFPPMDMWFAGEPINYYYLGQYFSAFLTRISFLDSAVTYNLMMATLFALAFVQSFSIGEILFEIYERNAPKFTPLRHSKVVCGLLCGALVCFSGNLHTVIYAWFVKGDPPSDYWFSNATRYIGYNPPVEHDRTIHEFPLYSFVVSDLHAHVINMIFALTVIALAIAVGMGILSRRKRPWTDPAFWAVVFLIGLFPATNFWDFPIYITVACAIYLYANLRVYEFSVRSCLDTLRQLVLTGCLAFAVVFPFHMSFVSMSTKVALVHTRSKFYQLLVLYGYQAVFFGMLLFVVYQAYRKLKPAPVRKSAKKSAKKSAQNQIQPAEDIHPLHIPVSEKQQPRFLFDFLEKINPADALALILFICALGLVLLPELVYVVDIYPSHPRANTMFKLCYQAFIMLALCVGYTSFRLVHLPNRSKFLLPAGILLFCAFVYPHYALEDWYWPHDFQGLDGTRYMLTHQERLGQEEEAAYERIFEDDYELVQYIKKNIQGAPVTVEVNGLSNTSYGRISANTGLPDLFNWYTHQQLWRNSDTAAYNERIADIETVYTQTDPDAVMNVIRKYQVKYIVIGKLERAKYPDNLNETLLTGLGEVVFQQNGTLLIKVTAS
jgi:YYY domain-containing protein